jgi:hypothetical protein
MADAKVTLKVVNGRLHLRFPFDQGLLDRVRAIPCAEWSRLHGCWTFPLTATAYVLIKTELGAACPEIEAELKSIKLRLADLGLKTRPFRHQEDALRFILGQFNVEVE